MRFPIKIAFMDNKAFRQSDSKCLIPLQEIGELIQPKVLSKGETPNSKFEHFTGVLGEGKAFHCQDLLKIIKLE